MVNVKKLLDVEDREILEATTGVSWVPENPREILLPYMSKVDEKTEENDLERRRQKAQEVMDGYEKVIKDCEILEAQIENRCKNVKVPINRSQHLNVIEAIGRVFGLQTEEITFEMYKICIKQLADITNNSTGEPQQ